MKERIAVKKQELTEEQETSWKINLEAALLAGDHRPEEKRAGSGKAQ